MMQYYKSATLHFPVSQLKEPNIPSSWRSSIL